MPFTDAELRNGAMMLANRAPHQNPAVASNSAACMAQHVAPESRSLVSAILAHPTYSKLAKGNSTMANALDPKVQRNRNASVRHQICGFNQVNLASAVTSGVNAIPYQRFRARRCVIAPMTISGGTDKGSSVTNWLVGTTPQFASLDGEPVSMFAAGSQAAFIDFDDCAPAIAISAQVNVAASITFWACLTGEAPDQTPQPRPVKTKVGRLPIKSTAIASGSTITITATPTVDFWGRKVCLADAQANQYGDAFNVTAGANGASGLLLQNIFVANNPQFLTAPTGTATSYVPCALFMGLYDLWLDLDKATVAVPYTFQVYNPGTVTLLFAGVIEGDIAA